MGGDWIFEARGKLKMMPGGGYWWGAAGGSSSWRWGRRRRAGWQAQPLPSLGGACRLQRRGLPSGPSWAGALGYHWTPKAWQFVTALVSKACTAKGYQPSFTRLFWLWNKTVYIWTYLFTLREAIPRKSCLLLDIFQKGGEGSNPNPKVLG